VNFLVGICIGGFLPLIPIVFAVGWMRVIYPLVKTRKLPIFFQSIPFLLLVLTAISIVSIINRARLNEFDGAWVVTAHWAWIIVGITSFIAILMLGSSRAILQNIGFLFALVTLVCWLVTLAWFVLVPSPEESFTRIYAPVNIAISVVFVFTSNAVVTNSLDKWKAIGWLIIATFSGVMISAYMNSFQSCLIC
jgi:hypothetical protein